MKRTSSKFLLYGIITAVVILGAYTLGTRRASPTASSATASADPMASHHTVSGNRTDVASMEGKPAPNFTLPDRDGKSYSLADLRGKTVVLFFNEGLMCYPSCWNQIAALASDPRLKGDNLVTLSIVVERASEWQSAVDKMPELAPATVLFDTNAKVSRAYGMLTTASSMHFGQFPGHSYIVIDPQGTIVHAFDDPNMSIHNDALVEQVQRISA